MKTSKEPYAKIDVEYLGKPRYALNFYTLKNDGAYGIQIDKLDPDRTNVLHSETAENIATSEAEAKKMIDNMFEDMF